jgi:hypothetical protein
MIIRIGLENGMEGRSLAWALDYPGAFSYGAEGSEAVLNLPRALLEHQERVNRHAAQGQPRLELGDFDLRLVETFECYTIDANFELAKDGYEVDAFFRDDWRPLDRAEAVRGVELLGWCQEDLLAIVEELPASKLDATYPGERWSIRGILKHVAGAEWWYLDRFGLGGMRSDIPKDPVLALKAVRKMLDKALIDLAGASLVTGKDGELWSPRKLLRRAVWHELDHTQHITKLL